MCGAVCVNLSFYRGHPFCSRPCIKKKKNVIFANPETAPPKRGRPVGAMTRNKPTYRNSGRIAKVLVCVVLLWCCCYPLSGVLCLFTYAVNACSFLLQLFVISNI